MTFSRRQVRAALTLLGASLAVAPPTLASTANPSIDPCAMLTVQEAETLLGEPVGPPTSQDNALGCVIAASAAPADRINLALVTIAPENAARLLKHLDDERGDEIPSLHGEPWYERSVVDAEHPHDRTFVIWRDRTSLTISLHSAKQNDAPSAFERVWAAVAMRLPTDEQP